MTQSSIFATLFTSIFNCLSQHQHFIDPVAGLLKAEPCRNTFKSHFVCKTEKDAI